jgi:hypothetical protein
MFVTDCIFIAGKIGDQLEKYGAWGYKMLWAVSR